MKGNIVGKEDETANQLPAGGEQDPANQILPGSAEETGTEAPGAGEKEQEGLKAAVVAEQKRRQEAEEQARQAQENLRLVQEQIALSQQQQPQQPEYDPDEYVQRGTMEETINQKVAQVVQTVQQQTFQAQNPDYLDIVGSGTGRAFRPSDALKEVIQADPSLVGLDQMVASGNPAALGVAYRLAKQHKELSELQAAVAASREQSKMNEIDAKTTPMSPAAAGGAGGTSFESQIPDELSDEFDTFYDSIKNGETETIRS